MAQEYEREAAGGKRLEGAVISIHRRSPTVGVSEMPCAIGATYVEYLKDQVSGSVPDVS